MENLSSLISKQIVSLEEGKSIGYILNVCIDNDTHKINGFLVCDEEEETLKFLDYKNILCVNNFALINSISDLSFGETVDANNPIGKIIITGKGEFVGRVLEVIIENNRAVKLITKNCEISPKNIKSFNTDYLFFETKKKKKKNNYSIFKTREIHDYKVKIMDNNLENKTEKNSGILQNKSVQNFYKIPFKSKFQTDCLIGKIASQDVYGKNNELIIRKNDIITEKTLKNAKKHGRENMLMFNCK